MAFRLLNQSIVTFQIEKCTPIRQLVMWMVFALAKVPSTHSFIHSFIRPLSHCKLSSSSPSPSHAIPIQWVHRVQTCLMQFVCACSFVPEWSLVHSLLGHPHPIHPPTLLCAIDHFCNVVVVDAPTCRLSLSLAVWVCPLYLRLMLLNCT